MRIFIIRTRESEEGLTKDGDSGCSQGKEGQDGGETGDMHFEGCLKLVYSERCLRREKVGRLREWVAGLDDDDGNI
jgi:hypothetical protein